MDINKAIESIADFRGKGTNWLKMAEIVSAIEKDGIWSEHYSSRTEWLKEAARLSGYGLRVVYRMLKVKEFLDMMVQNERILLPETEDIPLASLEIIQRLYPLQREKAKQLLGQAIHGSVTLKQVKTVYDDIVSQNILKAGKKKVMPRLAHNFRESAVMAVLQNPRVFIGKGKFETVQEFRGPFGFAVDLIAIKKAPTQDVFGFEFKYLHDEHAQRKSLPTLIQKVAFTSQFFRRYWIVFVANVGKKAVEEFSEDLKKLQLYNVGIAFFKPMSDSCTNKIELNFINSIYHPEISSPHEDGFFPSEKEYLPKWEHLLVEYVLSMRGKNLSKEKTIKR